MKKTTENTPKTQTHFQAPITLEFDAKLKELKNSLGAKNNTDLLQTLIAFYENPFKSGLSTPQKIERFVENELTNPTQKINTNTAQNWFKTAFGSQPNINTMKEVFALYSVEIEAHNAKF